MSKEDIESVQQKVEVAIEKPGRLLHFSDGVDEEIFEEVEQEIENAPPDDDDVDPKQLTWGPWFSYYAWKSSNKVLNVVDAAGEGLASFFGITTPKYQIEIEEYYRIQEEQTRLEEEAAGWVPNNAGGDIPLVLNEPAKEPEKPDK